MFWSKKSKPQTKITIWYESGNKSKICGLGEIPIKEETIIAKSIAFFNDPSPCYIHRGAVVIRLNEEVLASLKGMEEAHQIEVSHLEKEVLEYIELPDISHLMIENK